jgi:hypothetical protein
MTGKIASLLHLEAFDSVMRRNRLIIAAMLERVESGDDDT